MPKVEIEIQRTVTVTREESCTVVAEVPDSVYDEEGEIDLDEVGDWVEAAMRAGGSFAVSVEAAMEITDEDEDTDYHQIAVL